MDPKENKIHPSAFHLLGLMRFAYIEDPEIKVNDLILMCAVNLIEGMPVEDANLARTEGREMVSRGKRYLETMNRLEKIIKKEELKRLGFHEGEGQ